MKALIIIFSILIGIIFHQDKNEFNKKHLEILEKMSTFLSNKFYLKTDERFGVMFFGQNSIEFEIYTPLTEYKYKGTNETNVGYALLLTDKKNKKEVIEFCKNPINDNLFDIVETKSYYGYINYSLNETCAGFLGCQSCCDSLIKYTPTLLREIKKYLKDNYNQL